METKIGQLLSCPFCNGTAIMKSNTSAYFQWAIWIECRNCRARTVQMTFGNNGSINPKDCSYDGREAAAAFVAELWNRRDGVFTEQIRES